jgi:hypothetical protein
MKSEILMLGSTGKMQLLLKLEELAEFLLGVIIFNHLNFAWWYFPLLLLTPDIGMLGYLLNPKIGAWTYNIFHHKAVAIMILLFGFFENNQGVMLAGTILFSHAAFDRIMGYGLKYDDNFKHTHLGIVGKSENQATI